jgi:hypothetical protein
MSLLKTINHFSGETDMSLPETIKHPFGFARSPSAGNDGIFDWSWTQGCFGQGRISPMDFDGVVERRGNFLLFETKDLDVPVPAGQLITLKSAHALGCFTVMLIHGKTEPEKAEIWYPGRADKQHVVGKEAVRKKVGAWYSWADQNPRQAIDVDAALRLLNFATAILSGQKTAYASE